MDETKLNPIRAHMVRSQLAARGIRDERVLDAMGRVAREQFVPLSRRGSAYEDRALPLEEGQTISQPYMVARTLELAGVPADGRALDIGTGSGYQAALLGELAKEVVTIERIPSLAESARAKLAELGYDNVEVVVGDGSVGYADRAPYDAIVGAAAAPSAPETLKRQLAIGGRLVLPIGSRTMQRLTVVRRVSAEEFTLEEFEGCIYVPLVGAEGWSS